MLTRLGNLWKRSLNSSWIVWVEKVLDQQETALGVSLDIEGGHVTTPFMTPYVLLLSNIGLITPLYGALTLPWKAA
jgi:hypothetical protein